VLVAINAVVATDSVGSFIVSDLVRIRSVGWVRVAFLLVSTPLLVISGRLGDLKGRNKLFPYGFVILAVASPLYGLAPNFSLLVVFRAFQAVGAALLLSLGLGLLVEATPPSERGRAFGILVSAGLIGSVVGGLFTYAVGWQWVSLLSLPVAVIGAVASRRLIVSSPRSSEESFDGVGAAVFTGSTVCLILGFVFGYENGFANGWVLVLLAMSAILMVNFVWIESRVDSPLLNPEIFKSRGFSAALFNGFLFAATLASLDQAYLLGAVFDDVLPLAVAITWLLSAAIAGRVVDRSGPRPVALKGLALLVVGFLATQALGTDTGLWLGLSAGAMIGIGAGAFLAANYTFIMGSVEPARLGIAGGLLGFSLAVAALMTAVPLLTFFIRRFEERLAVESGAEAILSTYQGLTLIALVSTSVAMLLAWRFYEDQTATEHGLASSSPDGASVNQPR